MTKSETAARRREEWRLVVEWSSALQSIRRDAELLTKQAHAATIPMVASDAASVAQGMYLALERIEDAMW